MFIGHYALALAGKRAGKSPSLAVMFIAVQLLDHIWPILLLAGVESFEIDPGNTVLTPLNFTYYPYSHSLLMSVVWAVLFAFIYFLFTKNRQGTFLLGGLVLSHWVLDFLTHRPDLPISPFSDQRVGLGLWNVPVAEIILEAGMFGLGVYLYLVREKPKRKVAFGLLVVFLTVIYIMNIFGPPPPSVNAVAWSANLMWLFVLWAWWIEHGNRVG